MRKFNLTSVAVILGMMVSTVFVSCEEQEHELNLSENEEQRQEVYQQILNDEELFNEFMAEIHQNRDMMRNMYTREHVEAMMMNEPDVIDSVMVGMHAVLEQDSTLSRNPERRKRMMQNMMATMERDTAMYREMQERMAERPMDNRN